MEKRVVYCLALVLFLFPVNLKSMEKTEAEQKSNHSPEENSLYVSAIQFDGLPVLSMAGEEIGKMHGIVTDEESGLIHFFTFRQSSGLGEDIAVPYGGVRFYHEKAVLTVNSERLDSAPQQAGLSDAEFQKSLESHYGIAPAW